MSEPVRIGLRILGALLVLAGIGIVVLLFEPGPRKIADWLGDGCGHNSDLIRGSGCDLLDVLEFVAIGPVLMMVGAILLLTMRPAGKGPMIISVNRGGGGRGPGNPSG